MSKKDENVTVIEPLANINGNVDAKKEDAPDNAGENFMEAVM